MTSPYLVAPRALPDGSVSWEEQKPEIAKRIREGDPLLAWIGDPRLTLVLNTTFATDEAEQAKVRPDKRGLPRWEVWRAHEEGEPTLVVSCIAQRIDGDQLIRQLAMHDTRGRDLAQEMLDLRDAHEADLSKRHRDENEALADKLAWALGRDTGAPAQSGRVY